MKLFCQNVDNLLCICYLRFLHSTLFESLSDVLYTCSDDPLVPGLCFFIIQVTFYSFADTFFSTYLNIAGTCLFIFLNQFLTFLPSLKSTIHVSIPCFSSQHHPFHRLSINPSDLKKKRIFKKCNPIHTCFPISLFPRALLGLGFELIFLTGHQFCLIDFYFISSMITKSVKRDDEAKKYLLYFFLNCFN